MSNDRLRLGRRGALGLGLGIALTAQSRSASAAAVLNVTVYGGSFEDGWRKAVIEPFEKLNPGIKVNISQGLTFQAAALMRAQKDDVKVDVVMMDEVAATQVARGTFSAAVGADSAQHEWPVSRIPRGQ